MAINATKDDEELKETLKKDVIKRLFGYLTCYKKEIVIVTVLIFGSIACNMIYPLLVQRCIDVEIVEKNVRGLFIIIGIACALSAVNAVVNIIWRKIMARVSNDIVLNLRHQLFSHIQTLGLDFFDSRPAGKILARVTGDVNAMKDVLSSSITQLIPEGVSVIVVLVFMIAISPVLTLSALASIPFMIIGVYVCEIIGHKRWRIMRKKDSNMTAFIHEDLAGIGVVQSFNAEEEAKAEFSDIIDEHKKAFRDAVLIADTFSPSIEISYCIINFLMYFLAIKYLHVDKESIGTLTAFAMYTGSLFWPIRNLANYYNKLITNMSSAERIFEIMDTEPNVADKENAAEITEMKGEVVFENVSFAYPDEPDREILHDVSFTVKEGETIALVGPTGAGKTTIISLLCRFYDTTGGTVRIDGTDLRDVTLHSLRTHLGIMTQDTFLFSGTIRENLVYGRQDATEEEIIAACKAVHAHDFIMKTEKGYDTEITERGGGLSIGQKQLLAFARTLISNPSILILDEATSSIDTQTEILVQQGIEELLKKRTSFVVAHRLSTIKNADRIFVIDDGGILEEGNHTELMEKKGAYYNLYSAQFVSVN